MRAHIDSELGRSLRAARTEVRQLAAEAVERGRVEAATGLEAAIAREAAKGEATVAAAAAATEAAAGERLDARAGAAAERAVAAAWDASKRAPASWRGPRSPPRRRRRARSFSAG